MKACRQCKYYQPNSTSGFKLVHGLCMHPTSLMREMESPTESPKYNEAHTMRRTPLYVTVDYDAPPPFLICGEVGRYHVQDTDFNILVRELDVIEVWVLSLIWSCCLISFCKHP